MAGELSNEELANVLTQAMLAQKILRPHRDRLLELLRRQEQPPRPSDDHFPFPGAARLREFALDVEDMNPAFADALHELAAMGMDLAVTLKHVGLGPEIGMVSEIGIRAGARYLTRCHDIAAQNGARNPDLAAMPDELLYDALLAQRLPARPTTQAEAFARVEAAFYAVKLAQEHHLARCIESLRFGPQDEDDPVAAAAEHLARTDLISDDPATGEETPHPQASARSRVDVDKARDYLDSACTLVNLAVSHIDLAVAVLSGFLDPKEVASLSESTDTAAAISEDRFLRLTIL